MRCAYCTLQIVTAAPGQSASSTFATALHLNAGSLQCLATAHQVVRAVALDKCYRLAAQSFVSYSFYISVTTVPMRAWIGGKLAVPYVPISEGNFSEGMGYGAGAEFPSGVNLLYEPMV